MAQLPTEPQAGERPKAETIKKLIRHARASQIVNSPDIVAVPGPGGTSLLLRDRARVPSQSESRFPFQVYQAPPEEGGDNSELWRTFLVHEGKVSCKSPEDSDSADEPLRITVPADTEKYYVWLAISIKSGGLREPIVESVTIKHGTDPKEEGWEKFPSQDGVTDWNQTEAWNVYVVVATIETGADEDQELTLGQNVRSDLTVQLPVDHVIPLKDGSIRVYKKIIVFGPDNYVECPELKSFSSSGSSSGSSSAPSSSSAPASSGSSGGQSSGESGSAGGSALISSDVSSNALASVDYHWLYRFYRPNGAAWNAVAMETGWIYTPYSDAPAYVDLGSTVTIPNGTTLANPYCFALKVECTDLQGAYPTFLSTIIHGPLSSLNLQPQINFEDHKPKYGTLYLELAEVTANNGLLEVWEKCRDAVSYHEAIRAGYYEIGLIVGHVYEPADDTSSSQPSSSTPSSTPSSEPASSGASSGAGSSTPASSTPYSEPPSWSQPPQSKYAIVPYTPPGSKREQYVALACVESPDVRFEDVVKIPLRDRSRVRRKINRVFFAVCEPRSVEVISAVASSPAIVGARVSGREIVVEVARSPGLRLPSAVTLRLSGVRLGFGGKRFTRHTAADMANNSAFWSSALHPKT